MKYKTIKNFIRILKIIRLSKKKKIIIDVDGSDKKAGKEKALYNNNNCSDDELNQYLIQMRSWDKHLPENCN